jgi:hypothetical protein
MTTINGIIPRLRYRTGRVVAIRCAACRTWRKPRCFAPNANTCRICFADGKPARHRLEHARAALAKARGR